MHVSVTAMHEVDDENLAAADDGGGLLSCDSAGPGKHVLGPPAAGTALGVAGWGLCTFACDGQGEHVGMVSAAIENCAKLEVKAWECCSSSSNS